MVEKPGTWLRSCAGERHLMPDSEISVVPPLIVLGFFALFVGANVLSIRFSGWYALNKAYPCSKDAAPKNRRWGQSARIGWVQYNLGLVIGVDQGGLYIGALPLLDFMSPPFYIPWSALHIEGRRTFLWTYKLRLRADTGTLIVLDGKAARIVESAMGIQTL
jgi:hypothetical protein